MEQEKDEDYVDHSSELGKLILKLNKLEKKPSLDNSLGEILESFMRSLSNSGDFLKNGIFKLNFAEAALVLQSSASIYTKKVDLLWDTLNECQKRMLSLETEKNTDELERIEERERKYKRRRKSEVNPTNKETNIKLKSLHVDWEEMKNFQPTNFEKDSKLYSEWHKKMVRNWDLQPTQRINSLVDKQVLFRSSENAILDKDQDNEFVSYTSKLESAIGLEELLISNKRSYCDFSIELYMKLHGIPRFLLENSLRYEDLEEHSVEIEKYVAHYRDQYFSKNSIYDTDYESLNINKQKKLRRCSVSTVVSMQDMPDFDNIHIKTCQVNVLRLSIDDLGRFSRLSVDELRKACGDRAVSKEQNFQENFSTNNIVDANSDFPCCIGTKTMAEHIDIAPTDNHDESCRRQNSKSVLRVVISKSERRKVDKVCKIREKVSSVVFERIDYKTSNGNDFTRRITDGENIHKIPAKKKRSSKMMVKTIKTVVTVDLGNFESFYVSHYEPEEGERYEEDFLFDDPIECSSRIGLDEDDRPLLSTQDSGYESNYHYNEEISDYDIIKPSDSGDIIPTTENCGNANISPPATNDIVSATANCENDITRPSILDDTMPTTEINHNPSSQQSQNFENDETPLFQRVYEWKQFMQEKFRSLKSADFNIHEYGSNIMENFEDGKPQKFSNIVGGKSSAEVTRYFLSALQLANTNNIEINGVQSGKLSNETFELKLITKDRYYDKLKNYMAPSEQNYHDRLSNVMKLKKRRAEINPSESSSCKRNRFE